MVSNILVMSILGAYFSIKSIREKEKTLLIGYLYLITMFVGYIYTILDASGYY